MGRRAGSSESAGSAMQQQTVKHCQDGHHVFRAMRGLIADGAKEFSQKQFPFFMLFCKGIPVTKLKTLLVYTQYKLSRRGEFY